MLKQKTLENERFMFKNRIPGINLFSQVPNYAQARYAGQAIEFPKLYAGAVLLSQGRTPSTIGAKTLNFCVRDGNRCDHLAKGTNIQITKSLLCPSVRSHVKAGSEWGQVQYTGNPVFKIRVNSPRDADGGVSMAPGNYIARIK